MHWFVERPLGLQLADGVPCAGQRGQRAVGSVRGGLREPARPGIIAVGGHVQRGGGRSIPRSEEQHHHRSEKALESRSHRRFLLELNGYTACQKPGFSEKPGFFSGGSSLLNWASSQARAVRQSFFTVAGETSRMRRFFDVQTAKETQFDHSRCRSWSRANSASRSSSADDVYGIAVFGQADGFQQRQFAPARASLLGGPGAGVIDQDPAHHAGRHRTEMGAALPLDPRLVDHPQERLVHQRRGLQRVIPPFAPQFLSGNRLQLVIDQRQQRFQGSPLPLASF